MDWTRMGVQWHGDDDTDRLAARRAWLLGVGTRIETADDELRHLAGLKAAEAGGKGRASILAKVFQWLRQTPRSTL